MREGLWLTLYLLSSVAVDLLKIAASTGDKRGILRHKDDRLAGEVALTHHDEEKKKEKKKEKKSLLGEFHTGSTSPRP